LCAEAPLAERAARPLGRGRWLLDTEVAGVARGAADRVIFIDGGRIVEDSEPEEFFAHPKNKRLQDFLSKML